MSQDLILDSKANDAKHLARILYFAHGVTFVFSLGMLSILPIIVNYIKRPDTQGTIAYSHHSWMIRSFWIYVVLMAICWICYATFFLIPLGFLIFGLTWIWKAYRLIRGFIDLENNRAMPV